MDDVHRALDSSGKASIRNRDLPAHVVVYYVIAMALFMHVSSREVLRCLLEGVRWLLGPDSTIKVASKGGISRARSRLGVEPMRLLHDELVRPVAVRGKNATTKGAWYRDWRLVSLDGSTMDVADTPSNEAEFGRGGCSRGRTAFPQMRLVSLVEGGTHVLFGSQMGPYATGEVTLARELGKRLEPDMLCLADRCFFGYELWKQMAQSGAQLLWRVKTNICLPCVKRLEDGSCLSVVYPNRQARRHQRNGILVRVIEYHLEGTAKAQPLYRLITTILEPAQGPAAELAALYHERWEIELALDEIKTHLRGAKVVLRSKRPDLVRQELYGLLMAHYAIRGLMHEAALMADKDPDELSYVHAVRVVRRKIAAFAAFPPSGALCVPPGRVKGATRGKNVHQSRQVQIQRRKEKDEQLAHTQKEPICQ
jgi:hypothetical protein